MFGLLNNFFRCKIGEINCFADSAMGLVRKNNEDSLFVNERHTLFVVADGMGGGEMGEVASAVLTDEMKKVMDDDGFEARFKAVKEAFGAADARIKAIAAENGFKHMGTTGLVLLLDDEDKAKAKVFHVGDSRLYHVRGDSIRLLTRDHTVGGELSEYAKGPSSEALANRCNPLAHVLTRSLGMCDCSEIEVRDLSIGADSRLMLCTDGVHDVISDAELKKILAGKGDCAEMGAELARAVIKAGAPDNFTYIILKAQGVK